MISIIIPTYGDDAWRDMAWSRAYPSCVEQGAFEIIVHHEPDLTIGPARNAAAELASGDYLLFLDADDELETGYVEAMREAVDRNDYPRKMLFQPAVRYLRKGGQMVNPIMIPTKDLSHDNYLVIGTLVHHWMFEQVGGFSDYPHGFEDWSCWAKCWKAGAKITPVPKAIYNAYINPQSQHRQMWRDKKTQVATHLRVQAELFPEGTT